MKELKLIQNLNTNMIKHMDHLTDHFLQIMKINQSLGGMHRRQMDGQTD